MNVFTGLYGYESVMLICGFVLFVFALAAITVMIVQRRSFKAAMSLIVLAIVLMGYPGVQAVKFNGSVVEIDKLGTQPTAQVDPQQKQQYVATLAMVQSRAVGDPALLAKVANGYRAVGEVNRAYDLAQSVLAKQPTPATRKLLLPVLTAKLEQGTAAIKNVGAAAASVSQKQEVAAVASQLQAQAVALPAQSHVALGQAYAALGDPKRAAANFATAQRIDPRLKVDPAPPGTLRHLLPANGGR